MVARQQRPESAWAFPWPLITAKYKPTQCECSWGYSPNLGGTETPMVLKFFSMACMMHIHEALVYKNGQGK